MSIRRLSNAGLRFGWIPYEDNWASTGVDANWQWMDALAGRVVLDVVTTLPTTGLSAGNLYLMAADAGSQPNKLALYTVLIAADGAETFAWDFLAPANNFSIFVATKKAPYKFNGTTWAADSPAAISFYAGGVLTDSQLIAVLLPTVLLDLPAGLTGSRATAQTAPTATTVISVRKNGSEVATITFSAGVTVGTLAAASAIALITSDELSFVGPATADATFAGLAVSLLGLRKSA
jgi:hypothetical protein